MDLLNSVLLWLHFMALCLGGVASFGIPLLAARLASADPAARPALGQSMRLFSKVGAAAIGTLILTGAVLVYSKFGGFAGLGVWFTLKLLVVAVLVGVIAFNRRLGARAMAGDAAAAQLAPTMAKVAIGLLMIVVATAVLAFH